MSDLDPVKKPCADALTLSLKAAIALILSFSISISLFAFLYGTPRPAFFRWPDVVPDLTPFNPSPTEFTRPSATNVSHIAFGIGGSTRTWESRGKYSDLWWKPGVTRGFVFLDGEMPAAVRFKIGHRVSSEWKRFRVTAGSNSAVRMARVVVDLFRVGLPDVRWFVMGDDDTVFFPENVAAVLGKYDHRRMAYVGGNSESVEQDVMHSYDMAFGGGGFAISYPLAAALAGAMDGCLERYHYFYGSDQRVWACVAEFGVGLTTESGFHQIDIRGDPFGLLAAHPVAPLVSLHHLDTVKPLFPTKSQLQSVSLLMRAYKADPSRTLQQCFCYHPNHQWSVSISWGYAVQLYPIILTPTYLRTPLLTFQTWRSKSDGPFTFNTRPMDPNPCRRPIVFHFESVKNELDGRTLSTYRKLESKDINCNGNYTRVEEIVVLASKMDPREWKQRRRRDCCEITKGKDSRAKMMRIRIRKCKNKERIYI